MEHIKQVLRKLDEHKFYAQLPTCKFLKTELKFLGFIVGQGKLKTDRKKVQAIVDYPRPHSPHSVQELLTVLGMATYFRRFIPKYAGVTSPLMDSLKKGIHYNHKQAFDKVKHALANALVLALPDWYSGCIGNSNRWCAYARQPPYI